MNHDFRAALLELLACPFRVALVSGFVTISAQMNYHLHFMGKDLGVFPLEELRRRRTAGELTGQEAVWCQGMKDWQPLDVVLQGGAIKAGPSAPPPIPHSAKKSNSQTAVIIAVLIGTIMVAGVGFVSYTFVTNFIKSFRQIQSGKRGTDDSEGVAVASKPIVWTTNSLTEKDVLKQHKAFRTRQYLDGYRIRGDRNTSSDTDALRFLQLWVEGERATNKAELASLADKLAADPNCKDPVVLSISGLSSLEHFEKIHRLERAVKGFESSKHLAYPRFCATVELANSLSRSNNQARIKELDDAAVDLFKQTLEDGSLVSDDQTEVADRLLTGWGEKFFARKGAAICQASDAKSSTYKWLALVLEGEHQINEAWKLRGDGYADSVSGRGWKGFYQHLADARKPLTAAWELRPDWPLAASRMMTVALGEGDAEEMREWFDRATKAQIDHPGAWNGMRWGLRPRWHGSVAALKALGLAAINTGRFDTDAPRKYFDCIRDVEADTGVESGEHIYGHDDIWPQFQRMYEGYIADPSQKDVVDGWRSAYTVVAYYAEKYEVARKQLEALNWKIEPSYLTHRGNELSLLPLEIAARTGPLAADIKHADESICTQAAKGLAEYQKLASATNADERTRQYIQHRIAMVTFEQKLETREWLDFLPAATNDLNWVFARGTVKVLPDGSVEVQSGPEGHSLYCRSLVGENFEIKGEFDVVRTSNDGFQAGVVMGMPHPDESEWRSFRVKHNANEGDVSAYSHGWRVGGKLRQTQVNQKHNTFSFRLENDFATAHVNGTNVFDRTKAPSEISANEFLVGLGAYNDSNETVIRYSNVKIRRIKPEQSKK